MIDVLLGIETSCDETSAAILVRGTHGPELTSLVILSQDVHAVFGGVVPELASRAHVRTIMPVVDRALEAAHLDMGDVDAVAVTAGPGLIGSLLVGVSYAKSLTAATAKQLVGVHHLEGHVFAATLEDAELQPPFVALIISGGHTMLLDVPRWGSYRLLGQTRDDAAGEAYDKVASLLGLGYPGGPEVERTALAGRGRFEFPRPMINDGLDFSFSGLKTAVLHAVRNSDDVDRDRADLAASFQEAVFDVLGMKLERALDFTGYSTIVIGGGVACNQTLTTTLVQRFRQRARVANASPRLNADNAAMIARAGWFHLEEGRTSDGHLEAQARLPWPGLETEVNPSTMHVTG